MASLPRVIPLVVASALFMENTDGTVIATSLPRNPSVTTASFGAAPIAARSETFTANALWPRLSQSVQSRRK